MVPGSSPLCAVSVASGLLLTAYVPPQPPVETPAPDEQTIVVPWEDRTILVAEDIRLLLVPCEDRTICVPEPDRIVEPDEDNEREVDPDGP